MENNNSLGIDQLISRMSAEDLRTFLKTEIETHQIEEAITDVLSNRCNLLGEVSSNEKTLQELVTKREDALSNLNILVGEMYNKYTVEPTPQIDLSPVEEEVTEEVAEEA